MQRYFSNQKENNFFILSNDDSYHIIKVMRMNKSDSIEIIYNEKLYICEIEELNNPIKARIIEEKDDYNELGVKVIICQALVNEQKMDLILQKSTELGMSEFYPCKMRNCVIKENEKSNKKILRWQKICQEASEQSKRNIIPIVHDIVDIKGLCKINGDLKILCTVNSSTQNIKKVLSSSKKCDTIIIVIGPEGGFKEDEEKILMENGYIPSSLGKRVLRTETASISILSMINYEWMV